jgi:hypothetical protein
VFQSFLTETGFAFQDETNNPAYAYFLQPEAQKPTRESATKDLQSLQSPSSARN